MNEVHGETFALAHRGIGRCSPVRVLAQRLASFTPHNARGVDPLLIARSGGASMNELDLAGLTPQAPEEQQSAAMPAASIARAAVPEAAAAVWPGDRPSPAASETSLAPARASVIASAAQVQEARSEMMQVFSPPQQVAEARDEVFALAIPASAPQTLATPAPPWGLAAPTASVAALDDSSREATAPSVAPARSFPQAPQSVATNAPQQERASRAPIDPRHPASPMAPARQVQPGIATAAAPSRAHSERAPLREKPASIAPSALPAQPMGHIEAPAGATRVPPAAADHRVLERLAEAARKPGEEAVVRIGSVSVVMRPAPSAPPPQQISPAAPPPSAPMRIGHRNPWLSRGRGGE